VFLKKQRLASLLRDIMASRIHIEDLLIMRLSRQALPEEWEFNTVRSMTPEECLKKLQDLTGQDFGDDTARWKAWFDQDLEREALR